MCEDGEKEYETAVEDSGFIRETGGPDQEAPRNDRHTSEAIRAGQIHFARAAEGPRGLFSGTDGESPDYEREVPPHPNPLPRWGEGKKDRVRRGGDPYSPSRWYNEVWRGLYEEAAGQPALTGGREYKSADTYFRRLRELNPEMSPAEICVLAGEGAAFMIASQLEGGVFGWMHKPPDICMLASQAQSVEWYLRKMRGAPDRDGNHHPGPPPGKGREIVSAGASTNPIMVKFIEKIREVQDAGQEIDRVYGELRGIESASRGHAVAPGSRTLRRKRG